MFTKGVIVTGTKPAALIVPVAAVWRRAGQAPFVFVVEASRAHRRDVEIGFEQPQGFEVTRGLKPGDQVVGEQNLELADGLSVTLRP
jgi:multidrug efflux pump subunit AcrA (membrane-fusion protein)